MARRENRGTVETLWGKDLTIDQQVAELERRFVEIDYGESRLREWLEAGPPELRLFDQIILATDLVRERYAKRAPLSLELVFAEDSDDSDPLFCVTVRRQRDFPASAFKAIFDAIERDLDVNAVAVVC